MKTLVFGFFALMLTVAGAVAAEEAPDFSGTFEFDPKKGENLGMAAAIKETIVVTQTPETMVIDFTDVFQGNTTTRQVTYDLTGGPVENFAAMGDRAITVSQWSDGQLVSTWTMEGAIAGTEVVRTETRSLSEDGQTLTVETVRDDRPPMIMVYDRTE